MESREDFDKATAMIEHAATIEDLAMLVRKLCRKLELSDDKVLIAAAAPARDYLKRKGLEGSITRDTLMEAP